MSNWQDFVVVFYALALAVLGSALLWGVTAAFVRLAECFKRELPPNSSGPSGSTRPSRGLRKPGWSRGKRLVSGLSS